MYYLGVVIGIVCVISGNMFMYCVLVYVPDCVCGRVPRTAYVVDL